MDLTSNRALIPAHPLERNVNEAVGKDPQLAAYVRELKKREFAN